MVRQIVETLGVPEWQATFALRETHYRGVDEAIGYIYDNPGKCNDTAGMTELLHQSTTGPCLFLPETKN
jgi:hypothetical protein